ncbi:MAG: histidine phosphatase family protein [Bacilli bacterium]|nr:histidine phosphatase family protein [Bacilli bacterium]
MMKLYIMRHGETTTNIKHLICGKSESDLTINGILQARNVGERLKDIRFDAVFVSPLSRARITASNVVSQTIIVDKRLIERDYGDFEFKRKNDVNYDDFWNYNLNYNECNGENIKDLFKRMDLFIKDLLVKYSDKTILLVTHSGIARALHYYITGIPDDGDLTKLEIPNCCFRVYEIRGN